MVTEGENFQCSKNFQLENKFLPSSSSCTFVLLELNLSLKYMAQVLFLISFEDKRITLNKSMHDIKQVSSAFYVSTPLTLKTRMYQISIK